MSGDLPIPTCGAYRGVPLHDHQNEARLAVVRREIDAVLGMGDPGQLAAYAEGVGHAPEARMLAAAMCEAIFEQAVDERRVRPGIDLLRVKASVAGLHLQKRRSKRFYASNLDIWGPSEAGAVRRETPLE